VNCDEKLAGVATSSIHLQKDRISLALGREAVAREHVAIVGRTGLPLAYSELIGARLGELARARDGQAAAISRLCGMSMENEHPTKRSGLAC